MNWEEHLEYLNSSTEKELDDKIEEIKDRNSKAALESMNRIHWILALAQTDEQLIEKIREVESEFHNKTMGPIRPWILKHRKESYDKDPEAYKKQWEHVQEFAEKLRAEGLNESEDNDT